MGRRKENKKAKSYIVALLIVLILISIMIWLIINKKTVIFDGNGAEIGKMESIITYSKMSLEKNNFEKSESTFIGWKVYNEKNNKYSCKEGWFTEEEIKENNYTIDYLSTEEMVEKVNSIRGNKFIVIAQWSKPTNIIEVDDIFENKTTEISKILEEMQKITNISNKLQKVETISNKVQKVEKTECLEHNFRLIYEKLATCTENGIKIYNCINCYEAKTEILKAKGHKWIEKAVVPATSKENGKITYECEECKETKVDIIEKLQPTDLEILKENFEGENLIEIIGEDEDIPENITYNDITIKFHGDIYLKELSNDEYEMILDIVYNNKHYSVYVDPDNADILEIKEYNGKTEFRYGEIYRHESENMEIIVEENGDVKIYYEEESEELENYISTYENKFYVLEDESDRIRTFICIGEISEDGMYVVVDNKKYILKEKFDEIIAKLEEEKLEEIKRSKGYFTSTVTMVDSGEKVDIGFITVPIDQVIEKESEIDYFMMMCLSTEEEQAAGYGGFILSVLADMQMKVGTYDFRMTDGTVKTFRNPVFSIGLDIMHSSRKIIGYFPDDNTFKLLNTELDANVAETEGYKYSGYTKIEDGDLTNNGSFSMQGFEPSTTSTFKRNVFPEIDCTDLYKSNTNEFTLNFIGFNEKGMYIGINRFGYLFAESGARKYSIREDYIEELIDGTVVDYTGKKVIILEEDLYNKKWQRAFGNDGTIDIAKGDAIGYFDDDGNIIGMNELEGQIFINQNESSKLLMSSIKSEEVASNLELNLIQSEQQEECLEDLREDDIEKSNEICDDTEETEEKETESEIKCDIEIIEEIDKIKEIEQDINTEIVEDIEKIKEEDI